MGSAELFEVFWTAIWSTKIVRGSIASVKERIMAPLARLKVNIWSSGLFVSGVTEAACKARTSVTEINCRLATSRIAVADIVMKVSLTELASPRIAFSPFKS